MSNNKRRHKRFSPTAFLNMPVHLSPLLPYFGHPIEGKLIDLSAGGLSMLLEEIIPRGTKLTLTITFPGHMHVDSIIEIKRVEPRGRSYLIGLEFLNLPYSTAEKIDFMSHDYIDCESRIQKQASEICRYECAFYAMCSKPERMEPVVDLDVYLDLSFQNLQKTSA